MADLLLDEGDYASAVIPLSPEILRAIGQGITRWAKEEKGWADE